MCAPNIDRRKVIVSLGFAFNYFEFDTPLFTPYYAKAFRTKNNMQTKFPLHDNPLNDSCMCMHCTP